MKTFLLILAAMLGLTWTSQAQIGNPFTVVDGTSSAATATYTNALITATGVTNNTKIAIAPQYKDICLQFTGKWTTGTDNDRAAEISISKSVDGLTFMNMGTWTIAGSTSTVCDVTNYTVNAVSYLRVDFIYNAGTNSTLTNYAIKACVK